MDHAERPRRRWRAAGLLRDPSFLPRGRQLAAASAAAANGGGSGGGSPPSNVVRRGFRHAATWKLWI